MQKLVLVKCMSSYHSALKSAALMLSQPFRIISANVHVSISGYEKSSLTAAFSENGHDRTGEILFNRYKKENAKEKSSAFFFCMRQLFACLPQQIKSC